MKKLTKTFICALLVMMFIPLVTVSGISAFAANKESILIERVTDGADLAVDSVKAEGTDKSCYSSYETAGTLTLKSKSGTNAAQFDAYASSWVPTSKIGANDYVEVTFDVLELADSNTFGWFNGFTSALGGRADENNDLFSYFLRANAQAGFVSNGPNGAAAAFNAAGAPAPGWIDHGFEASYVANYVAAHANLTLKFEYYQNGTIKIYYGAIDRNPEDDYPAAPFVHSMTFTGAYTYTGKLDKYAFSFGIGNNSFDSVVIDNWQVSVINATDAADVEVITSADFTTMDQVVENPVAVNEVGANNYYKITYLDVTNPAADNRLESLAKIKYDENASVCFEMNTSISFFELPADKKVGYAFGLSARDTALEEATFIYFYNEGGLTYINAEVAGVAGNPVSLDKNLVSAEASFVDVSIVCTGDLGVTVNVCDKVYQLTANSVEGYMAITQTGEGNCHYAIGTELSLKNYTYRAGTGTNLEHPFNVDYLDFDQYTIQSTAAPHFTDVNAAEGVVIEDGALKFKGTSINTHFATAQTYADFILEFDYTTVAYADRPALNETGAAFGYSALGICFGKPEAVGSWVTGKLIMLRDIYAHKNDFAPTYVQFYKENNANDVHTVNLAERGEATAETEGAITDLAGNSFVVNPVEGMPAIYNATTRLKLVVINNHATLYGVNIVDGQPVGDYVVLIEGDVKDSYGYVSLSTDANGYFSIDNFRITNYDAEVLAGKTEAEILAEYEDGKVLADVIAPTKLPAPVVTLTDNVVSWEAVENATGYIVTVNGTAMAVQAETSYTLTDTTPGSYDVTVVAVSEGSKIWLDSVASETVVYVVEEPAPEPAEGGCAGSIGGSLIGLFALAGAGIAAFGKKRR